MSASRYVHDPKLQGETVQVTFDFTSEMTSSETISTQVVTASVYTGVDASPSAIISGSASASGKQVLQKITAGTAGVIYKLLCTITTSASQTLQQIMYLAILSDPI